MRSDVVIQAARRALITVAGFNALSAIGGAVGMFFTDGLGMPLSLLDNGPFTSFFWPAVLLLVVIGGTQTVAAVLLAGRRVSALLWTAVAGFGMVIWILVETIMIQGFGWLQGIYFATGLVELVLVMVLLGVMPGLPGIEPGTRNRPAKQAP